MRLSAIPKRVYRTLMLGIGTVAIAAVCSLLEVSMGTFLIAWGILLGAYGLVSCRAKDS